MKMPANIKTGLNWFQSIATLIALFLVFISLGIWIGDWRAEQVHREKTDTISQLRNDLLKAEKYLSELQNELGSKSASIEALKNELAAVNNQIIHHNEELKSNDSVKSREIDSLKSEISSQKKLLVDSDSQIELLKQQLTTRSPSLSFEIRPNANLNDAVIFAHNESDEPVRIIYRGFITWKNGNMVDFNGWNKNSYIVNPGKSISIISLKSIPGRGSQVTDKVGDAACIMYESVNRPMAGKWVSELWWSYTNEGSMVEIYKNDKIRAAKQSNNCSLVSAVPDNWNR